MAFDGKYLAPVFIGGKGNAKIWHYTTADADTAVDTSGYFNAMAHRLQIGDLIVRVTVNSLSAPTSVTSAGFHIVVSNDGTTVDVSNTTVISVTDSD